MKLVVLAFILVLPLIGTTNAVYYDQESSLANKFSAESLDFSLRDTSNVILSSPFFNLSGFKPGDSQAKTLRIKRDGSLDFKYNGQFVKTGGDDSFCQALQLEAKLGGVSKYDGNLDSFNLSPELTIDSSGQDDWEFILSLDSNDPALQNKTCQFNFVFKGWQLDSDGTWGFTDEEVLSNNVASGDWTTPPPPSTGSVVINEVYYDVDGSHGIEDKNEWIELYNNSDTAVSLKNWQLVDGGGNSKTINENVTLSARSFVVLSGENKTWTHYWTLPAGAITINWGGSSAWLNNDGDKLVLKDGGGNEKDMVAWENYVAGWSLNATEGKSIARKVKGVDTDSPSDWQVLDTPNPGTNPHPPETGPTVDFSLRSDKHAVSFSVNGIKKFKTLSYEITYDAKPETKQIAGTVGLTNEESFSRENLLLGTCSEVEGKVCVYDWGITKITLRVVLTLPNGETTEIIKEIAY